MHACGITVSILENALEEAGTHFITMNMCCCPEGLWNTETGWKILEQRRETWEWFLSNRKNSYLAVLLTGKTDVLPAGHMTPWRGPVEWGSQGLGRADRSGPGGFSQREQPGRLPKSPGSNGRQEAAPDAGTAWDGQAQDRTWDRPRQTVPGLRRRNNLRQEIRGNRFRSTTGVFPPKGWTDIQADNTPR